MKGNKNRESELKRLHKIRGAKLRQQYPNCHFLDEEYDEAIIGVLADQDQIVYDLEILLQISMDAYQANPALHDGYNSEEYYIRMAIGFVGTFLMCGDKCERGVLGKIPPLLLTPPDKLANWNIKEKFNNNV